MKKLFLIIPILFVGIACIAQENPAVTEKLKEKYSLVTYHDKGDGKGYYTISIEGKCGACDKDGNETIPPVWDKVFFNDTYYEVEKEGKVGIRGL